MGGPPIAPTRGETRGVLWHAWQIMCERGSFLQTFHSLVVLFLYSLIPVGRAICAGRILTISMHGKLTSFRHIILMVVVRDIALDWS